MVERPPVKRNVDGSIPSEYASTVFYEHCVDAPRAASRTADLLGNFRYGVLELPNHGMIVKTILKVPKRPTAKIHIVYDVADDITRCVVEERTDKTDAFKYDGKEFVFPNPHLISIAMSSIPEAICLSVLQRSDVFCMGQARTDFPKAMKKRAFWEELEQDIKNLHVAASVMLV